MPTLNTILSVLYIAIPVLVWLYSFWTSSRKDGFDQEKIFDLVLYGLLGALALGIIVDIVTRGQLSLKPQNLNPYTTASGFVGVCTLVVLKYKWSLYRVLDNLAISFVLAIAFWFLATFVKSQFKISYLLVSLALFISNYALRRCRPGFIKSGMKFSLISGIFCLVALLVLPKTPNLIFVGLLFTLSLAVLIFRLRSVYGKSVYGK
ncbi:MAG: hypothetical protein WC988_01840 [Patescibacteria group bacterium]